MNRRASDKPKSWREGIPLIQSIYARHSAGCCLHVFIDDGNLSNSHVNDNDWLNIEHDDCRQLWTLLQRMSVTQRKKLCSNWQREQP